MNFNLMFRIPMEQTKAEANKGLREFTEALVMFFVHTLPDEDSRQNILISLCYCNDPDCPTGYPHLLDTIESERPLSEKFLLTFSGYMPKVKLTQNERKIIVEYN